MDILNNHGEQNRRIGNEYNSYVFNGYIAGEAPIYLIPYHPDVIKNSNGVLTNGYGFGQE